MSPIRGVGRSGWRKGCAAERRERRVPQRAKPPPRSYGTRISFVPVSDAGCPAADLVVGHNVVPSRLNSLTIGGSVVMTLTFFATNGRREIDPRRDPRLGLYRGTRAGSLPTCRGTGRRRRVGRTRRGFRALDGSQTRP